MLITLDRWLARPVSLPESIADVLVLVTKLGFVFGLVCSMFVRASWPMIIVAIGLVAMLGLIALASRYAMLAFAVMTASGVWLCFARDTDDRASVTMLVGLIVYVVAVIAAVIRRNTPEDEPRYTTCSSRVPVER